MNKRHLILILIATILTVGAVFMIKGGWDFFFGKSITQDPLEILLVYDDKDFSLQNDPTTDKKRLCLKLNGKKDLLIDSMFFLPQVTIPETEWTGIQKNIFKITKIKRSEFSEYFKGYQNIVFLSTGDGFLLKKPQAAHKTQITLELTIDTTAQESEIQNEIEHVVRKIKQKEIGRRISEYKIKGGEKETELINQNVGLKIALPGGWRLVESKDGFIHLLKDFYNGEQRLIIQRIDSKTKKEQIIALKNQILEKNIQGEIDGSFPGIYTQKPAKVHMQKMKKGPWDIIELRGLWKMLNEPAPYGGPFISYVLSQTNKEGAVLFSFYIFDPGGNKADHLIEGEAIGTSLWELN